MPPKRKDLTKRLGDVTGQRGSADVNPFLSDLALFLTRDFSDIGPRRLDAQMTTGEGLRALGMLAGLPGLEFQGPGVDRVTGGLSLNTENDILQQQIKELFLTPPRRRPKRGRKNTSFPDVRIDL